MTIALKLRSNNVPRKKRVKHDGCAHSQPSHLTYLLKNEKLRQQV
jgi:hypothetical protein